MELRCPAFPAGGILPKAYTADGLDQSPALAWQGVPPQVRALALILEDPDAPAGLWTHWLVYDLAPTLGSLAANLPKAPTLPDGAKQGRNTWGRVGYNGPSPPPGKPHRYVFRLLALGDALGLAGGATRAEVDQALRDTVVAEARLTGLYGR